MKILCVIPSYYPAFKFGGPIASVHFLNKSLAKKGVEVTVYTTNIGLEGEVPINQEVNVDGVKVIYFNFSKIVLLIRFTISKNVSSSKEFIFLFLNGRIPATPYFRPF